MYILCKRNIFLTGIIPFDIHKNLTFTYKIKTNYNPSAYLDLTRKNPSRKTLVKLRISNHKLRIETGRYDNIPRLVTTGCAGSPIVTELKMKLNFY